MPNEIGPENPLLGHDFLGEHLRHEGAGFIGEIEPATDRLQALKIINVAQRLVPIIASIPEFKGTTGFVVTFIKVPDRFRTFTVQTGSISNYELASRFTALSETRVYNLKDKFIPASIMDNSIVLEAEGALAFSNGWILGIAGLGSREKDTAATFAVGIGSGLTTIDYARKLATDKCKLFMRNEAILTTPFVH